MKNKKKNIPQQESVRTKVVPQKTSSYDLEWMLVSAITLIAFVIRVYGIGRFSFWFDEYLHIIPAAEFLSGKGLHHIDGINGRFTTYIEIIFLGIFGVNEFAGRLPMALFSAATVPILYLLTLKMFNKKVAILTIIFFTLSLYMTFWGRVSRNYATFLPFYLLFTSYLLSFLEPVKDSISNLATKVSFSWKWLGITLLLFALALFNHPLTIFFIFAFSFYGATCWVINLIEGQGRVRFLNKYTPLLISFLAIFFMLTKSGNGFFRKILGILMPQNMLEFIVPDATRLADLWNKDAFEAFRFYADVLTTDMSYVWVLFIIGVVFGYKHYSKSVLLSLGQFGFIFLLLAFVFREGTVTRYLYFIYPFYLMLVSLGIVTLGEITFSKFIKKPNLNNSTFIKLITIVVVIVICKPSNLKAFLTRTEHGQLVDKNISEWYYTNWKDPIDYVRQNMTEGDVILSTVPNAPRLYLGVDSAKLGWFRQMHYDGNEKKYVQNIPDGKKVSGYTTEEFMSTIKNNPRGWLLADYYFYNVMTDPQARQFAIEHLDYHFGASRDGSVQVFSWDNSKPKTEETPILVELGKPLGRSQSDEKSFNLNLTGQDKVLFIFDEEGIDVSGEAVIQINGGQMFPIPKPENSRGWGKEYATMEIPAQYLNNGSNKAQFYYNPQVVADDIRPGFVIYNVRMR